MASDLRRISVAQLISLDEFVEYMRPYKLGSLGRAPREEDHKWVFWSEEKDESQCLENLAGTPDHGSQISKKIKDVLQEVRCDGWLWSLIQFWAPERREGRCFLTTSDQPFALYKLSKKACSYRKQCMERKIYICEEGDEEQKEEQLGPVGRAFHNERPESSPDVRLYTLQEFPLLDTASLCSLSRLIALPVFDTERRSCVGVLEIFGSLVNGHSPEGVILPFEQEFEVVGLALNYRCLQAVPKAEPDSWKEIKEALKVVAETHPLFLALAFVPSGSCDNDEHCRHFSDSGILKLAFSEQTLNRESFDEFIDAHRVFNLQKGKGVAGKAFASLKTCFCRNICDFTITKYPLVHYARFAKLKFSFAICLQTTQLKTDLLVLEFFLSPDSSDNPFSLLRSFLTKFKEHIKSFEIVAQDVPIEELFPKLRKSSSNRKVDSGDFFVRASDVGQMQQFHSFPELLPSRPDSPWPSLDVCNNLGRGDVCDFSSFECAASDNRGGICDFSMSENGASDLNWWVNKFFQNGSDSPHPDVEVLDNSGGGDFRHLSCSEGGASDLERLSTASDVSVTHVASSIKPKRLKREAEGEKLHISYDDIKQHFGKPLCDAAKCLQVSISTLKRRCREHGLRRWPRAQKNKINHSFNEMENASASSHGGNRSISISGIPSSLNSSLQVGLVTPNSSTKDNFHTLTIKVSYGHTTIRFWLGLMATLSELEKEVRRRLKLKVGTFTMTYDDEDGDCISITCDEDLQQYMVEMASMGKTTIKMSVHLNPS